MHHINFTEVDEARNRFQEDLLAFPDKLVFPVRNIEAKLTKEKEKLFMKFEEETSKVDFESLYKNYVKENLEAFFTKKLQYMKENNKQLTAINEATRHFTENFTKALDQIKLPFLTDGALTKSMKTLKAEHFEIFDQNTKEVDLQLKHKEDVEKELELFCNEKEERMLQRNAVAFKGTYIFITLFIYYLFINFQCGLLVNCLNDNL